MSESDLERVEERTPQQPNDASEQSDAKTHKEVLRRLEELGYIDAGLDI